MNSKNLFLTALLCLVAWCNAWADTATLNQDSNKNFTTDPAESEVTFSITNLGNWANATGGGATGNKHAAGYEVAANTNSVITWDNISTGHNIKITQVVVNASCAEGSWYSAKGFDVYTSVSGDKKETISKGGNDVKTLTLTGDTYFKNIGANGSITIAHGDTKMYINSVVITYTLEAEPFIEIEDANITNQWNRNLAADEYKCAAHNTTGFSVGASSDAEVASYDAVNNVFVLGHKSGIASFTVSADGVEDRTFTITADQDFYGYAANILGEAAIAETHNQSEAEALIRTYRANKIANVANGDDITYMMENANFEYSSDRLYGWTNNGYEVIEKNGIQVLHKERGGVATIDAASVQQTVQLPIGYYQMSVDMYSEYLDDIYMNFGAIEKKTKRGNNVGVTARYCVNQNEGESVLIKVGNPSTYDTFKKVSEFSNFSLTYICSKATYDAYMEQYNRAESLNNDARLQTATKEALNAAFVDINTLADADAIEAQTTVLKAACDAADADVEWAENNAAVINGNYYICHGTTALNRGANYGTRAIVTENGLSVNITTATNGIANLTFTDTNKKLFETTDHYIYTDYNNTGNYNFYLIGDDENGYKILLAGDRTKALGIKENMEWETEKFADVVMPVDVAEATVWHFAADKSKLNIKAERYGTFCAPYDVTLPDNVIAYSAAIDGTAVLLTEVGSVVPAYTPVIVKNDNNEEVTAYYYGKAATSATVTVGPLVGTLETMTVPVGAYVMQIQNGKQNFFIVAEDLQPTINKNKAYIVTENNARVLTFGVNDETAIEAIEALVDNKTEIYDLNGRRLSGLQKGINIVNGKKVLVK